ncbi:hypothetical protein TRFO_15572 [Tritrichomonas foetus]|uniref:Calcineurin-like phosphoesterase domain-containing protein n=1 Tax=Tritrichomonas foetus TaxID=1144522 RepID=A0A1J4KSI4_9EUKA|nr:hypothetical protein TRFO_15572 [Tritrichomonas foetus]|eukprot:OHT14066.1 hypothetical protein TRFO_15572 [Tritrichomonas foetus]
MELEKLYISSSDNEDPTDKNENITENRKSIVNSFAYLLSQYAWAAFIGFFIASGFIFPRYHPALVFTSNTPTKEWDISENPLIFSHATDIHLSFAEPLKIVNTRALINTMKIYKCDFNLISGDMVDSYGEKNWPKIGRQVTGDWELWKEIIEEETDRETFPIIDIAGNHDMWGIDDPLGKYNYFLDYSYTYNRSNTKTMKDFHVKTIVQNGLTFVLINTYKFPSIHPPYIYWSHPSKEILDDIEEEFERLKDQKFYVVCHYPVDHNWWIRSSKGHTFEEIMHDTRIIAYFSGHFHPLEAQIIHHGQGAVEFIGPGAYQFKAFGIVTIDNDRLVYHNIHLTKPPVKFLLTNPIPLDQVSSHQIFSQKKTELRVISYANKHVNLKVSGDVSGMMKFERKLPNGADLYSYPLELENGKYRVHITGDGCNITRDFVIGSTYKGVKEAAACYQRGLLFVKFAAIPIFLCLYYILCPFGQNKGLLHHITSKVESWIEGNAQKSFSISYLIYTIIFSPSLLRLRIQKLPKSIRYSMFFFLHYPLIFPIHFFKPIYGLHGWSFLCFIVIGKTIFYDEWALHMTIFFMLTIMIPATLLISSSKLFLMNHWIFKLNAFVSASLLIGISVVNYRWVGESVTVPNLFLNPTFVIIPAALYMSFYFILFRDKKRLRNGIDRLDSNY